MKELKNTKRSVTIHRKCSWSEFHQVKEPSNTAVLLTFTLSNSHVISISPDNYQIQILRPPPWYATIVTNTDTQKLDADEKEFGEIAKNMTTKETKLINAQMNLSLQTVEDTWQGVMTVKKRVTKNASWWMSEKTKFSSNHTRRRRVSKIKS